MDYDSHVDVSPSLLSCLSLHACRVGPTLAFKTYCAYELMVRIAETISPAHRPPKYNHKISNIDLFHHVVCQCIHKSARFTQFPAVKAAAYERDGQSIAEIISEELDLEYNDVKNIWLKRDQQWFST